MIIGTKTRQVEPDITVVEISGRLNLGNNLSQLEYMMKQLIEGGVRKIVIDVGSLNYLDSAAIGVFIGTNGIMDGKGGQIRIAGARGTVAQVFETVHMHRIMALDADVDASVELLSARGAGA